MEKMLVTTEELAAHLQDPDWVLFDTRHDLTDPEYGPDVYADGHIPGAYFLHTDFDLAGPKTGTNGRHPLPDPAVFAAKVERCGVAPGRQVVVYDDMGGNWAVRLWWMLRWLGHDRVALLDGHYPKWLAELRGHSRAVPAPREGDFKPRPRTGGDVDVRYVAGHLRNPGMKLVDARPVERFEGRKETIDPVAGHVPGAASRFWQKNLAKGGVFKAPEALRAEFAELLGGAAPENVVHMCGSGVTACHNLFAMELAGLPGSRLYPGSWSEWCADRSRPVATGP